MTERPRFSLTNQGGEILQWGDQEGADALAYALGGADDGPERLTHGFHTYPARMHPGIAARALQMFSSERASVLDPFCGSGTVLVEAMVSGRAATGVDLNILALRIAEVHVARRTPEQLRRFLEIVNAIQEASFARVQDRVPARAPLNADQRAAYAPHVLLELAGLREEIVKVEERFERRALEVVLSSLLVKLSLQRSDTDEGVVEKRLRKGLATEFFVRKSKELAERWAALAEATPPDAPAVRLELGDARSLSKLLRARHDLVLTSPPYGGTYDYHAHHARRYPWLGIDAQEMEQREVGARRRLSRAPDGVERWDEELLACLRSISGVTEREGRIVLLLGDAEVGGQRIDARDQIERLAPYASLVLRSAAAQRRPDFRGGPPRLEHLLLLEASVRPDHEPKRPAPPVEEPPQPPVAPRKREHAPPPPRKRPQKKP